MEMVLNSFEISFLQEVKEGWTPDHINIKDDTSLIRFGIWAFIKIGTMIREKSVFISEIEIIEKKDGSPVTELEYGIEEFINQSIIRYLPGVSFEGEESGGAIRENGVSLALDPLDGTRSFLSHAGTSATSMIFFRDGLPVIGMVLNAANGELGYVLKGKRTRLIQMNLFGEQHQVVNLPTYKNKSTGKLLVNFHPSKKADLLVNRLYKSWQEGEIDLVKSISGSPALALLEAAKGHSVYINLWKGPPALSYDLAAGILLVRGAGGNVLNTEGNPIPYIGHHGPFIAGLNPGHSLYLTKILKDI
jgi:fructose-1,6-bisphosphatase/inositol monophosphatase family enzyme